MSCLKANQSRLLTMYFLNRLCEDISTTPLLGILPYIIYILYNDNIDRSVTQMLDSLTRGAF